MEAMGTPWDPMGPHGDPMGPHGTPWDPMGTHGVPWSPMGSHENRGRKKIFCSVGFDVTPNWSGKILRIELDPVLHRFCRTEWWFSLKSTISDILGFSMEAMGTPWDPMGPHGVPWEPMGSHGDPWGPMGTLGDPWEPMDFP